MSQTMAVVLRQSESGKQTLSGVISSSGTIKKYFKAEIIE